MNLRELTSWNLCYNLGQIDLVVRDDISCSRMTGQPSDSKVRDALSYLRT